MPSSGHNQIIKRGLKTHLFLNFQAEASNVPNAEFGDDWFMWENWRVNKIFMDEFYNEINR